MYTIGEWCAAAYVYEKVVVVSGFIQMDQEARDKLLSSFDVSEVEEAYKKAGWYEGGNMKDVDRRGDREKAVRTGRDVQTLHETERVPAGGSVCGLCGDGGAVRGVG